ncbi:MAG TPA: BRCT domain-containing protein, partial [Nevskiaceae bacterium]|nr:BRCT domain-containing protein [Nevskiaceae bacterium]
AREPNHPFLQVPEPEPEDAFGGEQFRHTVPMLSIAKSYTQKEVDAFINRVATAAAELGIPRADVRIAVTPKIDGNSIMDYGDKLVTRGKNGTGYVVTSLLDKGVVVIGGERGGPCELAVSLKYFDEVLSGDFDHPRNMVAGLAGSDDLSEAHKQALEAGAIHLVPYRTLDARELTLDELSANWATVADEVQGVDYLCDGAVASVSSERLRSYMGMTSDSHRWNLAIKRNDEFGTTTVIAVDVTPGRTGKLVPRLQLAPLRLSGCTITYVTAHTASRVTDMKLGPGAVLQIVRSGGVIPKLHKLETPSTVEVDFSKCPSCGTATETRGAHLFCPNSLTCGPQAIRNLGHFFKTISVCKGFGPSVVEKLTAAGKATVRQVYDMSVEDFVAAGISAGVAKNLVAELTRSRQVPIEDAIFLGAHGCPDLGRGDSRKVLRHVPIAQLRTLTVERLQGIRGFGEKTSASIVRELGKRLDLIESMLALGFNLEATPLEGSQAAGGSPIAGKTVVFTGTMTSGSRDDMEAEARKLGASVGGSVTGKTNFLVCGEKVGAAKSDKALKLGVKVITEAEYRAMLAGG